MVLESKPYSMATMLGIRPSQICMIYMYAKIIKPRVLKIQPAMLFLDSLKT